MQIALSFQLQLGRDKQSAMFMAVCRGNILMQQPNVAILFHHWRTDQSWVGYSQNRVLCVVHVMHALHALM